MSFPPLPTSINGLAGPIRIDRPMRVERRHKHTIGLWLPTERRILVQATLPRAVGWQTLIHEAIHSYLYDAGVALTQDREEAVCDAVASGVLHIVGALGAKDRVVKDG